MLTTKNRGRFAAGALPFAVVLMGVSTSTSAAHGAAPLGVNAGAMAPKSAAGCSPNAEKPGEARIATTGLDEFEGADVTNKHVADVVSSIRNGDLRVHAAEDSLALEDVKVSTVDGSSDVIVTVPIWAGYGGVSNFTAVVSEGGAVSQTSETLMSQPDSGAYTVEKFVDGEPVGSNVTDLKFMTFYEMKQSNATGQASSSERAAEKDTKSCLIATLGISGAAAAAIVTACAGACATPIAGTAICVACIGAYAVLGSGSAAAVASCF